MRSPRPISVSRSTVPCSSTPARMVVSTSSRLRLSRTRESIPSVERRSESIKPAGPAPMIPTRVCLFITGLLASRLYLQGLRIIEEKPFVHVMHGDRKGSPLLYFGFAGGPPSDEEWRSYGLP